MIEDSASFLFHSKFELHLPNLVIDIAERQHVGRETSRNGVHDDRVGHLKGRQTIAKHAEADGVGLGYVRLKRRPAAVVVVVNESGMVPVASVRRVAAKDDEGRTSLAVLPRASRGESESRTIDKTADVLREGKIVPDLGARVEADEHIVDTLRVHALAANDRHDFIPVRRTVHDRVVRIACRRPQLAPAGGEHGPLLRLDVKDIQPVRGVGCCIGARATTENVKLLAVERGGQGVGVHVRALRVIELPLVVVDVVAVEAVVSLHCLDPDATIRVDVLANSDHAVQRDPGGVHEGVRCRRDELVDASVGIVEHRVGAAVDVTLLSSAEQEDGDLAVLLHSRGCSVSTHCCPVLVCLVGDLFKRSVWLATRNIPPESTRCLPRG